MKTFKNKILVIEGIKFKHADNNDKTIFTVESIDLMNEFDKDNQIEVCCISWGEGDNNKTVYPYKIVDDYFNIDKCWIVVP